MQARPWALEQDYAPAAEGRRRAAGGRPVPRHILPADKVEPSARRQDTPVVAHQDTPVVAHQDTPVVAHQDTPVVAHQDTPVVAHQDTRNGLPSPP